MFTPFAFVKQVTPVIVSSGPTGDTFDYTVGNFFDAYTQQSGVTTTNGINTNNGAWQLFYAHQSVTLSVGTGNIGLVPHTGGTNSWTWYYTVSTVANTIGSWNTPSAFTNTRSGTYTAGTLTTSNITTAKTVPAGYYFLLSNTGGPFYRTIKTLASSRTGTVSGSPYVTVVNRVCLGTWPSGGTTTVPSQFGGSGSGYTEYSGAVHVMSVKFS